MSTSTERRPAEALRRVLERPLASYQLVLGASALLVGLGLVMVLSSSSVLAYRSGGNSYGIVIKQGLFAVLGLGGAYIALKMPLAVIKKLATILLVAVLGLMLLTLVPGIGVEVGGNRNWLPLVGGFRLQPSEFAKLALIIWISALYANRQKALHGRRSTHAMLMPVLPVAGFVAGLVVLQKDLGTALVLFAVIFGMLLAVGLPRKLVASGVALLGVALVLLVATAPHRMDRLMNFLDPMSDPDRTGYQAIHSMMALATGGFWGVGLGGSRQKWGALPNAHTDFILAVVGEELGLFGTLIVLILFVVLVVTGVRIALRTKDQFAHYLAIGITVWISVQAAINIGMVLGLLPVIGITLPLMSYGGSSLLVTMTALGLLARCALTEPGAERALASRQRKAR
ncbi:putative lipid II flippase FtsW [Aeromicrobium sp. Leaf350]|uniref:putative lipid II flippase FtsW n=1 Tax=Aeromicrobium sp. Leaf350 TaxID=2876565 RepID=UPI001E5A6590|nr:putative lipid II flippase FtsW [Aeromicrobium sp. Leaf350]